MTQGFADSGQIRTDQDLEGLRDTSGSRRSSAGQPLEAERAKGGCQKPSAMEGVKTVDRQPEGGLRYHLRMSPEASKAKPSRLVIWLHPSGGSGNRLAESLVMRPNRDAMPCWCPTRSPGRLERRGTQTADPKISARCRPGVGNRPPGAHLVGFSAGGQAALLLWSANPARWAA